MNATNFEVTFNSKSKKFSCTNGKQVFSSKDKTKVEAKALEYAGGVAPVAAVLEEVLVKPKFKIVNDVVAETTPELSKKGEPLQRTKGKNGIIFVPSRGEYVYYVDNKHIFCSKDRAKVEARVSGNISAKVETAVKSTPKTPFVTASATVEVSKSMFSVAERFEFIENFTKMVIKGIIPSLVVTGSGGLGKTHTVTDTLNKAGLIGDVTDSIDSDYIFISGYSTPRNLYTTLYHNNGKVIVLDDCDSAFRDPLGANVLKAALDSKVHRIVSWGAESKDDTVPSRFEFTGKVIFISNLSIEKFPQAILSRSMLADLTLDTDEKLERIGQVFGKDGMYDAEDKEAVMEFLTENKDKIKDLNIRSAYNAIKMKLALGENWSRMALYSATLN